MSADILALLARATLALSAALIVILLLRKLLRDFFGARVAYAFWLLAPVAALASLLPARIVTIAATTPAQDLAAAGVALDPIQSVAANPAPIDTLAAAASFEAAPYIIGAWLGGFVLSLSLLLLGQQRLLARLRPRPSDALHEGEGVGPAVVGLIRPRIVVPADFDTRYSETERALVLEHERAHLRAGDLYANALAAFIQCLNWFNPLVHAARAALRIDQELACDERVMRRHGHARRAYAEAMLKTQLATRAIPLGCYWPAIGAQPLKERIAMLARPQTAAIKRALGAALCVTATLTSGAVAWAAQPARIAYVEAASSPASAPAATATPAAVSTPAPASAVTATPSLAALASPAARPLDSLAESTPATPLTDTASAALAPTQIELNIAPRPSPRIARALGAQLLKALTHGDRAAARELIEAGADVNYFMPGDGTPLVAAARHADMSTARLLLDAGADVNQAAPGDGNPSIAAAGRGHIEMIALFIAAGANVNAVVRGDETPLINAARQGHLAAASYLIEHGADVNLAVNAPTTRGVQRRSPLNMARRGGHSEMARLLERHGARD